MNDFFKLLFTTSGGILLLTGMGWAVRELVSFLKKKNKLLQKENYINGLRSIAKIYNSMERLRESESVSRVLLVELSNGGNIPRPGSRMYASAINVKHVDIGFERQILEWYDRVQVDESYIKMCIQVKDTGRPYIFDVEKHEPCLLKSYYVTEHIKYSEIYHVFTDGKDEKMFILSVATQTDGERFESPGLRASILAEVSFIQNEFEKYRTS